MLKVRTQDSTRYVVIILITDACRHLSIEGAGALFLLLVLLLVLVQKFVLKPMCHAGFCCFLDPRQPHQLQKLLIFKSFSFFGLD